MTSLVIIQQQQMATVTVPATTLPLYFTAEQIAAVLGSPLANVQSQWPLIDQALTDFGIFDKLTAVAAIATIGVEAHDFWPIEEYRNADGSIPSYWNGYNGGAYYHGRGLIQITHLYNYRALSQAIRDFYGIALSTADVEWALEPRWSAFALAWFFSTHGIQALASSYQWTAIRKVVNGGTTGLDEYLGYVRRLLAL